VSTLQRRAFVGRRPVYTHSERAAIARETAMTMLKDPNVHLSSPEIQARVDSVHASLVKPLGKELGIRRPTPGIAVIEGGEGAHGASALPNGSIVVHRQVVDLADRIGAAIASSRDEKEMIGNLKDVARGRFVAPAHLDRTRAQEYAKATVAFVIGHEMTHGVRQDGATGQAPIRKGMWGRAKRAAETASDAGGLELATRAGYSPMGQVGWSLYQMVETAVHGRDLDAKQQGSHPTPLARYTFAYRYLDNRKDTSRITNEGGSRQAGEPFFSAAQKSAFASIPSPEAVRKQLKELDRKTP